MRKIYAVLVFASLIISPAVASEWVSLIPDRPEGSLPEIKVIYSGPEATTVAISLPGFYKVQTSEGEALFVPGWGMTEPVGFPALPVAAFLTALPDGRSVSIQVQRQEDRTFEGLAIRLTEEPETDRSTPQPAPVPQAWDGMYPADNAVPGAAGYIAELPVVSIRTYPFRVDSDTGDLLVSARMQVTVHHDFGTKDWPAVALSPNLARRCANTVVNFSTVPRTAKRSGDIRYLIVTPPALEQVIQPLADWRNKSGLKTKVRTIPFASPSSVKSVIREYTALDYVLIVGDSNDIPLGDWFGDHWYACITGGANPDVYADLSIGRLCGSDGNRITPQISKILDYEKSPPLGDWLKRTLLVAHKEQYPGKYTQCKNEILSAMSASSDWEVRPYYGGVSGKNNAGVSAMINNGINLLNYRGHGDTQEWWSWNLSGESYYNSDVEALDNNDMRPIVLNIACCCGDITKYSMNEAWLDTPGGAVASLGATEPSYTIPNHDFDKKLYEAIFEQNITDIGGVLDYANDYIIVYHGSLGVANAKMYLWNGDPAMEVWLTVPATTLDAAYAAGIDAGSQSFEVEVTDSGAPVEGALVCCYLEDEVFEVGETGTDGKVTLDISPTSPTYMYVTVTHDGYLPHEGSVQVQGGSLFFDTNKISARHGGTVNFTLDAGAASANRGYFMLGSVTGTIPGTPLPGGMVTLPLNFDPFTSIIISLLNTSVFTDFAGTLDLNGQGAAQLNAVPVSAQLVGASLYFAFGLKGPFDFVSNPVTIKIVP